MEIYYEKIPLIFIFILKTVFFILQNMFWSLHTSSAVAHMKSTLNIQIIIGLLQCFSVVKSIFKKNFYWP